jgi:hypothetical protein
MKPFLAPSVVLLAATCFGASVLYVPLSGLHRPATGEQDVHVDGRHNIPR